MILRKFDPDAKRHYIETESGAKIYQPYHPPLTTIVLSDLRDVSIDASLISDNEDEAHWDDLVIWDDLLNEEVLFQSLPQADQNAIESKLDQIAADAAHELYYEHAIAQAEYYADCLEDR